MKTKLTKRQQAQNLWNLCVAAESQMSNEEKARIEQLAPSVPKSDRDRVYGSSTSTSDHWAAKYGSR
jgi:hypothetical protein